MLSGYKALSRRFVKSFPAMSRGFETETELAVHALELRMPCGEEEARYRPRPEGSNSKLRTFRDGIKILMLILRLVKDERPLQFFALRQSFALCDCWTACSPGDCYLPRNRPSTTFPHCNSFARPCDNRNS